MKKLSLIICFAFVVSYVQAQVKLNLSLLSDNHTYLVSLKSETTLEAPTNTTGMVQVVLKIPSQYFFEAGEIQSLIPNVRWVDNVYVDAPLASPEWSFVAFTLEAPFTKSINYVEEEETALFTFKNVATNNPCEAPIYLVDNDELIVKNAIENGYNLTQNFTILGVRGNAVNGLLNAEIDCAQLTNTKESQPELIDFVQVSPVPSSELVRIKWMNTMGHSNKITLLVMNKLSEEVQRQSVHNLPGENEIQMNVSRWSPGVYTFRFVSENLSSKVHKMVVVH